ncbi:transcription elongation factor GreAB [Clostridium botulinum]|nr:transcription elongation factor GreAB [Clostridium botulinum]NFR15092.1 transcription elongation factor GreAB [Clostridium botulinum]NFR44828.1 transcription elongation factor GreAB [Clostridium botulinum]NFS51312.1 transcription elongation factor GreAB [Clostridium botulinum]
MRKYFKAITIIIVVILLSGCNNIKFEKYIGENLNVGVIGEIPEVREDNVAFNKITFKDLEEKNTLSKYDTIFITKDNLIDASEGKYSSIYKEGIVPFFFIESTKGDIPFIYEDLSYEEVPQQSNPPSYAVGIYKKDNKLSSIEYGLYNDIENKKNIEDVYSRIFTTISENK